MLQGKIQGLEWVGSLKNNSPSRLRLSLRRGGGEIKHESCRFKKIHVSSVQNKCKNCTYTAGEEGRQTTSVIIQAVI